MAYEEDHPSEIQAWTCVDCGATGTGRRFLFTHASECPEFGDREDHGVTSMTVIEEVPVKSPLSPRRLT